MNLIFIFFHFRKIYNFIRFCSKENENNQDISVLMNHLVDLFSGAFAWSGDSFLMIFSLLVLKNEPQIKTEFEYEYIKHFIINH